VKSGLDVLSLVEPAHLALRFELLLLQYETCMIVPEFAAARTALLHAVETARLLGSPEQLARATSLYLLGDRLDSQVVELAEETLQGLGEASPHLRARLMAGLAVGARHRDACSAETSARAALALARDSGDTDAVHAALVACKFFLVESPRAREWLAVEDELVAIGTVSGPVAGPSRWFYGLGRGRALARLTLGDRTGFDDGLRRVEARSGELQNPAAHWNNLLSRGTRALLDGRFGEVEALAAAHRSLGAAQEGPWAVQMGKLALERGRAGEFESEVVRIAAAEPGNTVLVSMLAFTHAETGRHDDALRIVEELAADDFQRVVRWMPRTAFAYVAEVTVALGRMDLAARVYQLYLPYSGLAAVSGFASHCPGAVDRYLGQLAGTLGKWDEAEAHYTAAIELETGLRSPPLLARTEYWYGRMLLERGRPGDADQARALLKSAVETAEALGMARLAAQASELS
jgi:tetratricopeptide (TPR) repeat protein